MNGDELIEPMRRGADNRLYPTELGWLLPPNLAMVPLNESAKEIFALFKRSIGNQVATRVTGFKPIRDALGHEVDGEPEFGHEPQGFITNQGHVVTAGSSSLQMRNGIPDTGGGGSTATLDRGVARILGQEPNRQHSGPPMTQVRVLGTIAPPAVQNG